MVRRRLVLGVTAVALVAMAVAGCGGGGGEASEPPPTEPPVTVSSPTTVLSEEDAVLAAYQGYWDTWLAANDPPNPDHPDLAKYATGPVLAKALESIANRAAVQQALRLPSDSISSHEPRVVSVTGTRAVVYDCSVDDGLVVAEGSGFVLDDAVVTWQYTATLEKSDTWRVSELQAIERTDGVSGCAA